MNQQTHYTLNALLSEVKEQLRRSFPVRRWVVAEIGQLNIASTGHCYIELLERDGKTTQLLAKCQATIWKGAFTTLQRQFRSATGYELGSGMKVLVYVDVTYHQVYGLSLNISDVDPSFTVGEIEMRRREIIAKLTKDGDIDRNSEVEMPQLIQRIAVVSSERAAGYEDFCNELQSNEYGYRYKISLFAAVVQGDGAEESIVSALERIYMQSDRFDVVVIIRGGGSKSDLACFDSYAIAHMVSYSPLPVISGVGHERDESIVDMCAAVPLKTPTAVARYLIDSSLECDNQLSELKDYLQQIVSEELFSKNQQLSLALRRVEVEVKDAIREQTVNFAGYQQLFKSLVSSILYKREQGISISVEQLSKREKEQIAKREERLNSSYDLIKNRVVLELQQQKNMLELQKTQTEGFDPKRIFALGYSFAKVRGRTLRSTKQVALGETVDIKLYNGSIEATITDICNGKKTDNIR